jgi:6-pyruvoyltetrahydropterin/6-carboxytetrahydropterin synthase
VWILRVRDGFSSAHFLRGYEGKCENLHGHNWIVEVEVEGHELDSKTGILLDFKILKSVVRDVLSDLDHILLNDLEYFKKFNPSAENIARYIFEALKERLKAYNVSLRSVTVWESESASATYCTSDSSR